MDSEKKILRVLDLLTKAPEAEVESLSDGAPAHAKSIKRILGSQNVVGVGIREKISNDKDTGKLALTFYVEKKVALRNLRGDQLIPPTVPESLSGPEAIPTDIIVLGKIVPEVNKTRHPLQPGNSIGHIKVTAGTFGAVVTKDKSFYLLSNSHVLANSGKAKVGDPIVYPGKFDGGAMPDDLVAHLKDFHPFIKGGDFVNHVDCAIAEPTEARLPDLVSEIKDFGLPKGTIKPKRGMKIVKVGRTTGKTTGEIVDIHFRFTLDYEGVGEIGYIDQVLCTRYTAGGDSGSLVLDEATGRAVGLHFAGANGGSVFNPIEDVLNALGVKLVTKSIGTPQAKPATRAAAKKPGTKTSGTPSAKASGKKPAKKGAAKKK